MVRRPAAARGSEHGPGRPPRRHASPPGLCLGELGRGACPARRGRALGPGASYLSVFRFAGATAFAGYGLALLQGSIWWGRKWSATVKSVFDALVYALVTAGTFGWLWP